MRRSRLRRTVICMPPLAALCGLGWVIAIELQSSRLQAEFFTRFARDLTFEVAPGLNPVRHFPAGGPYDERLGYSRLPSFIASLTKRGFTVERQARLSKRLAAFVARGGFPVFREKTQAGLTLMDRGGQVMFASRHPERIYPSFDAISPLVVDTLLFIENRELLDPRYPTRNPAVEWDRMAAILQGALVKIVNPDVRLAGGSTLATQIEKFRHSPEGRTDNVTEKLRQMISASVRAYQLGSDTTEARRRIVVDYINSTPLAGRRGFGEVIGLGDGLLAWYGADFDAVNRALSTPLGESAGLAERALAYKQVLSLLLAQRRPTYYLRGDQDALGDLTNRYLHLLASVGVIDAALRDAALGIDLRLLERAPEAIRDSFVGRKAANSVRFELLSLLGVPSLYQLDRLDLAVETSFDAAAQTGASQVLARLSDKAYAGTLGLTGERLLDRGDPAKVVYSLALYERGEHANYVRVQADSLDRPFDVTDGAMLDLGSTAKLRTLITYLEVIAEIHTRHSEMPAQQLREISAAASDALTAWVTLQLANSADRSLQTLLEAAMQRRYSASPFERFFTGGGVHQFANFDRHDNGRVMSAAEAFRNSVNLVFIRMMRDIVRYHVANGPVPAAELFSDPSHPQRRVYLERFADREGSDYLRRFYRAYSGRTPDQALALLAGRIRPTPPKLAAVFRFVRPEADPIAFRAFLNDWVPDATLNDAAPAELYDKYAEERYSIADRAYVAGVHPLELWLVRFLQAQPQASLAAVLEASAGERQAAYAWLFRTRHKRAQDTRIRILLEEEAFLHIHHAWQRLGYPFDSLVPSYATAIGSSADRPSALAELMGIILNDGMRLPTVRVERLHFGATTPYETVMAHTPGGGQRVLASEIAATVRNALIDVVDQGTGRRVRGAAVGAGGVELKIGGKTGTGDHRLKRYARGGHLIQSTVVNRTATFVFFIGKRFFGTVTAHVAGPQAADYRFTSALPVQLLNALIPALQPLLDQSEEGSSEAAA